MARKHQISPVNIALIDSLRKGGFGSKHISKETGLPLRTVQRWLKRCRDNTGKLAPVKKTAPGRSRILSKRTLTLIKRQLSVSPFLTGREIKQNYPDLLTHVSIRTIQRRTLEDLDMKSYRAAKKPLLTPAHKAKRVRFAQDHKDWPLEKWRRVVWSAESMFYVTGTPHKRVRRPRNSDRYDERYTVNAVKHPSSVMVWGCFSYFGVGNLVMLDKGVSMNTETYLDLLHDNLEECFDKCNGETFMQDGASCHTANIVREWFGMCELNYFESWPANSPDLNPIENVWSMMKKKLQDLDTSSVAKLKQAVVQVWGELSPTYLEKLADSVPRRLESVIKRKGNSTKY